MPDAIEAPQTLSRSLGPIAVMLLAFSALSPVFSVYIAGDAILKLAGTGAALAMLIGGVTAAILGMLYAEVGAAFPGAGGIYPSLSMLLGRMTAFPYIVLMAPIASEGSASRPWVWRTMRGCSRRVSPICPWCSAGSSRPRASPCSTSDSGPW